MHSFEDFIKPFAREFNPDNLPISRSTGLYDELALDSFDAFRLLLFLEDLADVPFPPNDVPKLFTVQDAYRYYVDLAAFALEE